MPEGLHLLVFEEVRAIAVHDGIRVFEAHMADQSLGSVGELLVVVPPVGTEYLDAGGGIASAGLSPYRTADDDHQQRDDPEQGSG